MPKTGTVIGTSVSLLVVSFLLSCLGCFVPLDIIAAVVIGWAFFLYRVVPELTISWSGLATAVVTLGAFAVGLHQLLKRTGVPRPPGSESDRWQVRWSAAIVAGIVVSFVAGISVVGVAHQSVWMVTSDERFTESSWEAIRRIHSRNNLHEIGLAAHNYHDVWESFPSGGLFTDAGWPLHSWETQLLPYLDQAPLYEQIDHSVPWNDPANAEWFSQQIDLFVNPMVGRRDYDERYFTSKDGHAMSHYAANERLFWPNSGFRIADIEDGTSNTLLAGEVGANFKPWGDPVNWRDPAVGINQSPEGFGSPFNGGAHFLFCDGATRFISDQIDPQILRAISTPAGGEEVDEF